MTTTVLVRDEPNGVLRERVRRLVGVPPGQLRALVVGLVVLCLATGAVGVVEIAHRRAILTEVTQQSIPLARAALEVYQSLSDADATANSVFLAGDQATAAQRGRYLTDVEEAAIALSAAAAGASGETANTVAILTAQLARYSGLVETAHTNNRHGFSVGAAYLREASALARETLLPEAQRLYREELAKLASAQRDAGSVTWFAIVVGVLTLAALVAGQLYLRETTRRTLNRGLLAATAAVLAAVVWFAVASVGAAGHSAAAQRGMAQTEALAEARITALTARSMEALALVARSSGKSYEDGFQQARATLDGGVDVRGSLAAAAAGAGHHPQAKEAVDAAIGLWGQWRELNDRNNADPAVADLTRAAALSSDLDERLASAFQHAQTRFESESVSAVGALSVADVAAAVLVLIAAVGVVLGVEPRIREYR